MINYALIETFEKNKIKKKKNKKNKQHDFPFTAYMENYTLKIL